MQKQSYSSRAREHVKLKVTVHTMNITILMFIVKFQSELSTSKKLNDPAGCKESINLKIPFSQRRF